MTVNKTPSSLNQSGLSVIPASSSEERPNPIAEEAKRPEFLHDIEKNLKEFSNSFHKPVHGSVSSEFIGILQTDIDYLRAEYVRQRVPATDSRMKRLNQCTVELNELAAEMFSVESPTKGGPVLGKTELARDIANTIADSTSATKKALLGLAQRGCSILHVRGDGHCLFTSIAAQLITKENLEKLRGKRASLGPLGLPGVEFDSLIQTSLDKIHARETREDILSDPVIAKGWVQFLRNVAVNWWEQKWNARDERVGVFIASQMADSGLQGVEPEEVIASYKESMSSMEIPLWGGEQEIVALQEALDFPIHIVDLQTPEKQRRLPLIPVDAQSSDLFLLLWPGHYEVLSVPTSQ